MAAIIFANGVYSFISGAIAFEMNGVTLLGKLLLLGEILVILAVVAVELKIYQRTFKSR